VNQSPKLGALMALVATLALGGCSAGTNGRPVATSGGERMRLAPDPAFAGAQIVVAFGDPSARLDRYRYEWRKNGAVIPETNAPTLEPAEFAKGDRIEVTALGPGAGEDRRMRADVRVINTPPTITRVTVMPPATSDRAELCAVPEAIDRDGDSLTYKYRWFRNGRVIEGETGPRIPMASLALGERVAVEVVANDGESDSPPVRGETAPLQNRPPHFTSQPVVPGPADSVYHYQAVAIDEDQDALRYELVGGPPGMVVEPNGEVSWNIPKGTARGGEYAITIRAVDSKGAAATQQFTFRLAPVAPKR
jgi:hypothetical protein